MTSAPLLALRQIELTYPSRSGATQALTTINLEIEVGEFVCIVGPSGCGKTSLLKIIAGFHRSTAGEALIAGQAIRGPAADRGVVFQQPALYPWLTLAGNVGFGLRMRGMDTRQRATRVAQLLQLVGLQEFGRRPPYELSGGMQQRAAIARVLINEPQIMLMDEPFGALDALTREHMQDELLKIWRATRTTIILITHSVEEAVYLGTRTLVMSARPGRIIADIATPFSREAGGGREIKARPDFIATRETILRQIWQQ